VGYRFWMGPEELGELGRFTTSCFSQDLSLALISILNRPPFPRSVLSGSKTEETIEREHTIVVSLPIISSRIALRPIRQSTSQLAGMYIPW